MARLALGLVALALACALGVANAALPAYEDWYPGLNQEAQRVVDGVSHTGIGRELTGVDRQKLFSTWAALRHDPHGRRLMTLLAMTPTPAPPLNPPPPNPPAPAPNPPTPGPNPPAPIPPTPVPNPPAPKPPTPVPSPPAPTYGGSGPSGGNSNSGARSIPNAIGGSTATTTSGSSSSSTLAKPAAVTSTYGSYGGYGTTANPPATSGSYGTTATAAAKAAPPSPKIAYGPAPGPAPAAYHMLAYYTGYPKVTAAASRTLTNVSDSSECGLVCRLDSQCQAFTYVKSGSVPPAVAKTCFLFYSLASQGDTTGTHVGHPNDATAYPTLRYMDVSYPTPAAPLVTESGTIGLPYPSSYYSS